MGSHVMCTFYEIFCLVSFWLVYKKMFVTFENIFTK